MVMMNLYAFYYFSFASTVYSSSPQLLSTQVIVTNSMIITYQTLRMYSNKWLGALLLIQLMLYGQLMNDS